jgi:hypothetical protein
MMQCSCPDGDWKTISLQSAMKTRLVPGCGFSGGLCIVSAVLLLIAGFALAGSTAASADECIQYLDQGRMNWYSGKMTAESDLFVQRPADQPDSGRAVLVRQARMEARKRLWQSLLQLRIDRGLFVRDVLSRDQELAQAILGKIHHSQLQTLNLGSGEVRVQALVKLRGELSGRLIPRSIWFEQVRPQDWEAAPDAPQAPDNAADPSPSAVYTGLIVDLRGFDFQPSLIIRIFDDFGQELYGPTLVDPQFAIANGICVYTTSLQSALSSERAGDNPFLVRAGGIRPDANHGIRFVPQSAEAFLKASQLEAIYQECRVVVVTREGRP